MGPYPPRVRRDWEGSEGQLPPRARPPLIGQGRVGEPPRPMALGLGKRRDEKF